ncbi:hypothetical protein O3G_MSEX001581 [Manduca sexta]|uniref:Cytochrome b561 domain-containing protein n=1 Tax=Manduca sexta TaxID=7130 RepID=A0A922CAK1_MANSE|nr:hypothetical protein O3G_MSEX001581 [Manduca sexta]
MDLANKMCNLECLKNEAPVAEFVGPVKIVLVDPPPRLYKRRVWGSALIVVAHMMIGATTMTLFYYSLAFKLKFGANLHIFLCTAGYQLCLPSGILMVNNLNGAAAPMKTQEKRTQHLFLQIFGMACAIFGSIAVFFFDELSLSEFTIHSLTGIAAGILGILTVALGPIVHFTKDTAHGVSKLPHIFFGVLTLISSTLCFVLGLIKPQFSSWVPVPEMLTCTIIFGIKEY